MIKNLHRDEGRALIVIVWILALVIIIGAAGLGLTAMGAIKYPPEAVNWPGVGPLLVKFNAQFYTDDDATDDETGQADEFQTAEQSFEGMDNDTAKLLRDVSFKASKIEDLEGQLESKNDQIAKLEERIQTLKTQLDDYKPENRKALIAIYDRMETRAVIEILSQLTPERTVVILSSMKESKAAEVLSQMDPDIALRITELMAGFTAQELLGNRDLTGRGNIPPAAKNANQPVVNPDEAETVGPPDNPPDEDTSDEDEEKEKEKQSSSLGGSE